MIVEHGQRMAASGRYGEVALIVHLPQIVGRGPLEALEGPALLALAPIQPAMPAQDLGDRRDGRHLGVSQGRQAEGDLASTPCRMRTADRQDSGLDGAGRAPGRAMRSARAIGQTRAAFAGIPGQPLVGRRRADPIAPAQLAQVRSLLASQANKLFAQRHDRHLRPRHGTAPQSLSQCQKCQPCLRTPVNDVSGLNTMGAGRGGGEPLRSRARNPLSIAPCFCRKSAGPHPNPPPQKGGGNRKRMP